MVKKEAGMTLIEVLATLVLLTLVTGIIWTTVSIATKFNVSETTSLQLQQEANYIISEMQQVHRNCFTYKLSITDDEIRINECLDSNNSVINSFNGVISNSYHYLPEIKNQKFKPSAKNSFYENEDNVKIKVENDLELNDLILIDPINKKKRVKISTTISRYKTKDENN
ncbi:prepilin-type N-terminal cleavage/methylation domain-containing protein [Sporosarcina sp.]|uniref:prepilin-type N-terminal cleavage/methylation domain-containing protein n=1 Tax=Sporosarcina sp. TaxID=49982 RepID=UPI00261E0846|nr:prepilin-type N-terminal cleavage/methylation domain-containing protein [Sporosarcina sp.]